MYVCNSPDTASWLEVKLSSCDNDRLGTVSSSYEESPIGGPYSVLGGLHRVLAFLSLLGIILILLDTVFQILLLPFGILPGLLLSLKLCPVGWVAQMHT